MSLVTDLYEMCTHHGTRIPQPNTSQLANAIAALAAPDNTYLCVQPQPDSGWYVEVTLPDPNTAEVFNGPYQIQFQDSQATTEKWSAYGDDPVTIATRILAWTQSMINSRRGHQSAP